MRRLINLPLIFIIAIFLFLSTSLLLDEPFVWPDEAIYGDIARNVMLEGRLGTDLLKGLIDGVENHAYWIPPLFMYANAAWFKVFGFSIATQRLFTVFLGSTFIVIFYFLCIKFISLKNGRTNKLLTITAALLLSVDSVFLKASRLSRPEIMVFVLIGISLLLFLQSFKEKQAHNRQRFLFLTGLFLGLALITHLIAIAFAASVGISLIYSQRKKLFDFKRYYFFSAGILIPVAVWLVSIYPNYHFLNNQLSLISESRNFTIPWYFNVFNFPLLKKLNYIIYILLSLGFVLFTLKNRKQSYILLSLILIFTWGFATLGEIYWYTAYPLPFVYLALFILISHSLGSKRLFSSAAKLSLMLICLILLYSNLSDYYTLFNIYKDTDAYNTFRSQVAQAVPEGKSIFLTSIPDAYYAFDPKKNDLYEYPTFTLDLIKYNQFLDGIDYVVFNNFFSPPAISRYTDQYIAKNFDSSQELSFPYHLLIIKLKNRNSRVKAN